MLCCGLLDWYLETNIGKLNNKGLQYLTCNMGPNLFLLLLLPLPLCSQGKHLLRFLTLCQRQEESDGQYDIEFDGDQLLYVEPSSYMIFQRLPEFADQWIPDPSLRKEAYLDLGTCKYNLGNIPEVVDSPTSMIYSKEYIEIGVPNTLICFVNEFHPPEINIIWTKNGELVNQSYISQTQYYSNSDYTFRTSSYLRFTPQENDIYACGVEHMSLQTPLTRFWEVETDELKNSQNVETALCVCGVILGLMGGYIGLWFIRKASKSCRRSPASISPYLITQTISMTWLTTFTKHSLQVFLYSFCLSTPSPTSFV
ncbi:H-2 class II histocompatibility antigen, A-U alpha chain-like [Cynoglossus semilaevis]|uniref:H-2 class II histocompatibility antigen, A-U alpha chain-like n=1 Tax=Cynoglossus semilaevis TaxID=244447 RepID=UPI0007DCA033|nr:H-2 class II histocompatibility antigen, A-U alpha chain-like [Cynoglossus semilaevis]